LNVFLFFQAEDGIRDFHVTGVQTCALPIWRSPSPWVASTAATTLSIALEREPLTRQRSPAGAEASAVTSAWARESRLRKCRAPRSEERRVGKEGRSLRTRAPSSTTPKPRQH